MAISGRLTRKLYEMFGQDAGDDLMSWMQTVDSQRAEFRELHEATTSRFEARLGESTARLRAEISELRRELQVGLARLETGIEKRTASLMRWSFVFWIGSVAAVAGAVAALDRFLH